MLISSHLWNTHITYLTHILSLIFKAYKKLIKFFFQYVKMTNNYYQKQKERSTWKISTSFQSREIQKAKKSPRKISNFYWKKKSKKRQYHCKCNNNFSEEQKQKLAEYRRNYHIKPKKELLGHFVDFLKILGQLNFLFHGLVLKVFKKNLKFFMSLKILNLKKNIFSRSPWNIKKIINFLWVKKFIFFLVTLGCSEMNYYQIFSEIPSLILPIFFLRNLLS